MTTTLGTRLAELTRAAQGPSGPEQLRALADLLDEAWIPSRCCDAARAVRESADEVEQLRADLRAERGDGPAEEVVVTRRGVVSTSPMTFHARLSVDLGEAARVGAPYLDDLVLRLRAAVERQLGVRDRLRGPRYQECER